MSFPILNKKRRKQIDIKVATVNIAGAERDEKAEPRKYEIIANLLSEVDIIGLQEVVKVYDNCKVIRDDIRTLQQMSPLLHYHSYFFAHLDSTQNSHPKKWESPVFKGYYKKGYKILQGTAILLNHQHFFWDLWRNDKKGYCSGQIIPWYIEKPTFYLGNRDTEPRSLLLSRIRLANRFILFCCTQLSTLKEENQKKGGVDLRIPTVRGEKIREKQINWIVDYIQSYQQEKLNNDNDYEKEPLILVGDFNAKPNAKELKNLAKLDLKPVPIAGTNTVDYTHRKYKIFIDLIYVSNNIKSTAARIINLQEHEVGKDQRISDHNPVIANLTIS